MVHVIKLFRKERNIPIAVSVWKKIIDCISSKLFSSMVNVSKMSIASLNCLNLYSHFKNESQKIEKKMIIIINPENGGSVVKMYVCINFFNWKYKTKTSVIKPQDNNWSSRKSVFMCGSTQHKTKNSIYKRGLH